MYQKLATLLLTIVCALPAVAEETSTPRLEGFHQSLAAKVRSRVSLSSAEQAWLAGQPEVNIRIGPVPPFHFVDGEPQGISVDYLKVFCEAFELRCHFVDGLSWHEGLERFKAGKGVDLLPTIKRTPEREAYTLFSRDYLDAPWVIYTRRDNRFVGSVDDLRDRLVAVEQSFVVQKLLEKEHPEIALLPVKNSLAAIMAVATGEADAYIGNLMTGTYLAQRHGLSSIQIAAPTGFGSHNLAFGIRKGLPELASIIDKTLDAFTPQEVSAIQDRWLTIEYDAVDWSTVRQVGAVAAVVMLLLLASFAYWNRKLQLEILQRKETEQALSQSEQQLAGIVESADEAIISIDEKQRVVLFNESAEKIFGYDREEVLGQRLDMLLPASLQQRHAEMVAQFLASSRQGFQRDLRGPMYGQRKDGAEFPMEAGLSKQRMPGQTIMTVVLRDISAQAEVEEEKNQLHRQLVQAQKMEAIGQLTGGIAHDFNNILATIMGNTELAQMTAGRLDEPKLQRYLSQIASSSQRARDLVAKMLAFSRGGQSERQPLALQDTVQEAIDMLGSILPSSIQVDFSAEPGLPELQADPVQVNQVITNLCINARDAMNRRGKLDIVVRMAELAPQECVSCHELFSGRFIEVAVSDDGEGIDPQMLHRIFDPFFTTKNVGEGSGMGLSMVHGIMHDHGGHILVDSEPGHGTTFRLFFPVDEHARPSRRYATAGVSSQLTLATGAHRPHILVVDDEAALLDFETELLSSLGYQVTGCDSSEQAKALLESSQHFDLLFTDQTMPGLTGLDLAKLSRQARPGMPVVLVSGYSSELAGDGLASADIDAFVNKPFDSAQLSSLLSELLG